MALAISKKIYFYEVIRLQQVQYAPPQWNSDFLAWCIGVILETNVAENVLSIVIIMSNIGLKITRMHQG